jgi:RecB family exonuclease
VALEERLVDGDVLDRHRALEAVELDDAVDQQERVAVRQQLEDLPDVEAGVARPLRVRGRAP